MRVTSTITTLRALIAEIAERPESDLSDDVAVDEYFDNDEYCWEELLDKLSEQFELTEDQVAGLVFGHQSEVPSHLPSLQRISAFSERAKQLLARLDNPMPKVTVASLAASLDAGHSVPSGQYHERTHPPRDAASIFLGCTTTVIAVVSLVAFMVVAVAAPDRCQPEWPSVTRMLADVATLGSLSCLAVFCGSYVPGLWVIFRDSRSSL